MKNSAYILSLLILAGNFSCDLKDPLDDLDCDKIITLTSDQTSTIANGKNKIMLTASLGEEVQANVAVTFHTDYGFFEGSGNLQKFTVTSSEKKATAEVVLGTDVRDFKVSAQVADNCQQFADLACQPSLPHYIDFKTDRIQIQANRSEQAMLTVNLFRNPGEGSTSENVKVNFTAVANNSDAKADMPEFAFSTGGIVAISLRSATNAIGVVTVTASVESALGGTITKSLDIEFVD